MPFPVQVAAAWAAVVALIVGVTLGIVLLLAQVRVVVWALVGALLVTAVLQPLTARLRAAGAPRLPAAGAVFVGLLVAVIGALWLIGRQVADQFDDLWARLSEGLEELRDWAVETRPVSADELDRLAEQARQGLENGAGGLAGGAATVVGTAAQFVSGVVLALFVTFFMLADGRRLWACVVSVFPHVRGPWPLPRRELRRRLKHGRLVMSSARAVTQGVRRVRYLRLLPRQRRRARTCTPGAACPSSGLSG